MGEGTTPLLERLAWVTSLCVIYLFSLKLKKKWSQQLVLNLFTKNKNKSKKQKKKKKKKPGAFGQRKIKPVS